MMNRKEEERILIDRYLANSLSGTELKLFMDRLESDAEFQREVVFQNLIVEAIREADQQRLQGAIVETIRYKKPALPLGLRLILLFLVITTSGILFWQYIGTGSVYEEGRPKFSFNIFKVKPKDTLAVKEKKKEVIIQDTASTVFQEEQGLTDNESDTTVSPPDNELIASDEVIVKKDQLLMSMPIKPIPLDNTRDEKSLAQSASDKLNPAAGLPDENAIDSYQVEFWISPVNYRGYKMYNDKLILFGIEEPDAVRLYSFNNNLLMKYGKEFFRLQPVNDFVSFNVVKEMNLPAALR